jgi:hypothetical protein
MIYSLLGIVDLPLVFPKPLKPDYTAPYASVYQSYSRFLFEYTGDLSIMPTVENHLAGIPSWVVDFRQRKVNTTTGLALKIIPGTLASPKFSDDGNEMTVEGLNRSTCINVFHPVKIQSSVLILDALEVSKAVRKFEHVILRAASRQSGESLEITIKRWLYYSLEYSQYAKFRPLSQWLYRIYFILSGRKDTTEISATQKNDAADDAEMADTNDYNSDILAWLLTCPLSPSDENDAADTEIASHDIQALGFNGDKSDNSGQPLPGFGSLSHPDFLALFGLIKGSPSQLSHFVTTNGTVGILVWTDILPEVGDIVAIFKGSVVASLIRPWKDTSKFAFVGGCKLYTDDDRGPYYDNVFFSQYQLECITLV